MTFKPRVGLVGSGARARGGRVRPVRKRRDRRQCGRDGGERRRGRELGGYRRRVRRGGDFGRRGRRVRRGRIQRRRGGELGGRGRRVRRRRQPAAARRAAARAALAGSGGATGAGGAAGARGGAGGAAGSVRNGRRRRRPRWRRGHGDRGRGRRGGQRWLVRQRRRPRHDHEDARHRRRLVGTSGRLRAADDRHAPVRRVLRHEPRHDRRAARADQRHLDVRAPADDGRLGQPQLHRDGHRRRRVHPRVRQHAHRAADLLPQRAAEQRRHVLERDYGRQRRIELHLPAVLPRHRGQPRLQLPRRLERQRQPHLQHLRHRHARLAPAAERAVHRRADPAQRLPGRPGARPRRLLAHGLGVARLAQRRDQPRSVVRAQPRSRPVAERRRHQS